MIVPWVSRKKFDRLDESHRVLRLNHDVLNSEIVHLRSGRIRRAGELIDAKAQTERLLTKLTTASMLIADLEKKLSRAEEERDRWRAAHEGETYTTTAGRA